MINIEAEVVRLRAVEPSDIDLLYKWENDSDMWHISGTIAPFSHHTLSLFIEAQREDIFSSKQMRLMICKIADNEAIGALDIFEFDPQNQRAGIGIMIAPEFRQRGYAADALKAVERYGADYLRLHQLWCNVEEDNHASLKLFASQDYKEVGRKEDWNYSPDGYKAEIMLQKIIGNR